MPPRIDTLAIVGVGLIGGSIGLAAKRNGVAGRVIGIGRREVSLQEATKVGAVDATSIDLNAAKDADLVVVCTPVATIVDIVKQIAAINPSAVITAARNSKSARNWPTCNSWAAIRWRGIIAAVAATPRRIC